MNDKKWTQLSTETLNKRYHDFLKMLQYSGVIGLNNAKLFRNNESGKEVIIINNKKYKAKINKSKRSGKRNEP